MAENPIQAVEQAIGNIVHHTHNAIDAAVKDAEAKFASEKIVIANDVRTAVTSVVDAAKADAPEIEAALKKGAQDAVAALEAALAAHGL